MKLCLAWIPAIALTIACGATKAPTGPSETPVPKTTFGTGQHRVGTDITAARYFADPAPGCYWERRAGGADASMAIAANQFIGYDAAQWIVDVLASDAIFETSAECGTWQSAPVHGSRASIASGVWLVGTQLSPGTYRSNVSAGCYWERRRDFKGELDSIIDNAFVSGGGQRLVTIAGSDAGFLSTHECGTWTRAATQSVGGMNGGSSDIERNRTLYRQRIGLDGPQQ